MNQDFIAWVGQGTIADRTREHLGESDRGVILMRKKMFEQLEVVKNGGDPLGTIRDAEKNHSVHLPVVGGLPRSVPPGQDGPRRFPFLAGQPREIVDELQRLWAELSGVGSEQAGV
jgi:5,5'-dehydrodivanillate O-demethylase